MICTDGINICMYPYVLLAADSTVFHWVNVCIDVMLICAEIVQALFHI